MGIHGEKVTYSCPTKENVFISYQAEELQILQIGELLRPYQQYPHPAQAGAAGRAMLRPRVLSYFRGKGGFILDFFWHHPFPFKSSKNMHSKTITSFTLYWGDSRREREREEEEGVTAFSHSRIFHITGFSFFSSVLLIHPRSSYPFNHRLKTQGGGKRGRNCI